MAQMRYTTLSPARLVDEFSRNARDATARFGAMDGARLQWQPAATHWSIAQCFDHLLSIDRQMRQAIERAVHGGEPPSIWQRLPLWPRLLGRMLITSQGPGGRKYTAPAGAQPAHSGIAPEIVARFVAAQDDTIAAVHTLSDAEGKRIMASPFAAPITYRVIDGYRLMAAHQRRHIEQASVVAAHPQFPRR